VFIAHDALLQTRHYPRITSYPFLDEDTIDLGSSPPSSRELTSHQLLGRTEGSALFSFLRLAARTETQTYVSLLLQGDKHMNDLFFLSTTTSQLFDHGVKCRIQQGLNTID
jgi:hypothetical protein